MHLEKELRKIHIVENKNKNLRPLHRSNKKWLAENYPNGNCKVCNSDKDLEQFPVKQITIFLQHK
jgi:hypothetical protein